MVETDFLIIGAGIIGLSVAKELSCRFKDARIVITEKETEPAYHASGRNSGVLHAGFYYSSDSLKARFTAEGNRILTEYCLEHGIPINRCGKVVVAKDEKELNGIFELKRRGELNNVNVQLIDEKELEDIEPNANTYKKALYSPTTSAVNPKEVSIHIADSLKSKVIFIFQNPMLKIKNDIAITNKGKIRFKHLINCAGLYADKIAHQFGVGLRYTMLPFKGVYLKYTDSSLLQKHVYPVPDLEYPFLGVHFTKTVDGQVKVGPTAMPAFWREQYNGTENFKLSELSEIFFHTSRLFITNTFNFRRLALEELRKHMKKYLIKQSCHLVKKIDINNFGGYSSPGIRAQLFDKSCSNLVMDFVVEHGERSTHILNAVSPAFTCSLAFAKYVVDNIKNY